MATQKQSNASTVSITTTCFLSAFCRRDLSMEEVRSISCIFDALLDPSLPYEAKEWTLRVHLAKHQRNVIMKLPDSVKEVAAKLAVKLASFTGRDITTKPSGSS